MKQVSTGSISAMFDKLDSAVVGWVSPNLEDPRDRMPAREQWLLHRIDQVALVLGTYLLFVYVSYMFMYDKKKEDRKRKMYEIDRASKKKRAVVSISQKIRNGPILFFTMALYNMAQVLLCAYMVKEAVLGALERKFSVVCNEFDTNPKNRRIAHVLHVFYLSKVLDFADTVFMILKGNWRQVSFLHVYHHSSIFAIYWLILNSAYDGDIFLTIVLNGFIHFVMYGYYFATTLNIKVPLAVKKLVTNMQLIQFACMMVQATFLLSMPSCEYPKNITRLYLFYIMSMFGLFSHFKRVSYSKKKKKPV